MSTANDAGRRHDSWIRVGNWHDVTDHRGGRRHSNIGRPADFWGRIQEESRGSDCRRPERVFVWSVSRQYTEREGPDDHGLHWSPDLASGEEPTLPKAKSAATRALRQHRIEHILAGGDVGYGDAPTGAQIRESIAARRALESGQSMVMESGEHEDVTWQRRLSKPTGTFGTTEAYRLVYQGEQLDTLTKGRTAHEAATEFREHVDTRPARQAAADAAQQEAIAESARIELARERERARLNPLQYSEVADAWKAATGTAPTRSQLSRWAHDGVSQPEHDASWYQAGVRAKQARDAMTPEQMRSQARREMAAGLAYEAAETAHRADLADPGHQERMRLRDEQSAAGKRNAQAMARQLALTQAQQIHLRETTGLSLPHPGDMKAGAAQPDYMVATGHLLAGRLGEGQAALDLARQRAAEVGDHGALARLEKLSVQVAKATPQAAPPALVRTARVDTSTVTAIDQAGTEHTITWQDGQVTVTCPAGTLSAPDGGDPTATARTLAGQLASRERAAVPDTEPEA